MTAYSPYWWDVTGWMTIYGLDFSIVWITKNKNTIIIRSSNRVKIHIFEMIKLIASSKSTKSHESFTQFTKKVKYDCHCLCWMTFSFRFHFVGSCPCLQPAYPIPSSGSEVTFNLLVPRLNVRRASSPNFTWLYNTSFKGPKFTLSYFYCQWQYKICSNLDTIEIT